MGAIPFQNRLLRATKVIELRMPAAGRVITQANAMGFIRSQLSAIMDLEKVSVKKILKDFAFVLIEIEIFVRIEDFHSHVFNIAHSFFLKIYYSVWISIKAPLQRHGMRSNTPDHLSLLSRIHSKF